MRRTDVDDRRAEFTLGSLPEANEPAGSGETLRSRLAAAAVSAIGLLLLSIPAFDIWDDVSDLHWGVATTLAENAVLICLAFLLVGGGLWLARLDWSEADTLLVAKWTVGGTIVLSGVYALVILLQLQAMGRLKPYVLAADGVLMGTVAAFAVGLYDVQRRRSRRELAVERDRFRSFFLGTDVRIVSLVHGGSELITGDENPAFEETFSTGFDELLRTAEAAEGSAFDHDQFVRATLDGEHYHEEIRVPPESLTPQARDDAEDRVTDGRFYDLRTVNVAESETFVVLPDITAQRERERLLGERTERLAREKTARERELEERTNQLEFLHSLLRHDVQNGMMVIDSRAEFLREELDGREEAFAETIRSRAREVSEQIDRVRTALDTLTEGTETVAVDLTTLLEKRVETFRDNYPDVTVRTEIEDGLQVEADNILDDVIANLLRNAVEHNDEEVEVEVTAAEGPETVRVEVADNGPGIPEERRDQVFRRGVSGADDGRNDSGGSGFGLFFIDTMVESYDGEVRIEDNEHEGARFVVELPPADETFGK